MKAGCRSRRVESAVRATVGEWGGGIKAMQGAVVGDDGQGAAESAVLGRPLLKRSSNRCVQ